MRRQLGLPMTFQRDDNQSFEGIRVELPFISFQVGRGGWEGYTAQDGDDAYERARQRVRARLSFFRHLATFFAVVFAIVLIDLITGGGLSQVVLWVTGIWGAILVWQLFNVFVFPMVWSRETEERMIQEELRKHRDDEVMDA